MLKALTQKKGFHINLGFPMCVCDKPFTLVRDAAQLRAWVKENGDVPIAKAGDPAKTVDAADQPTMEDIEAAAKFMNEMEIDLGKDREVLTADRAAFEEEKRLFQEEQKATATPPPDPDTEPTPDTEKPAKDSKAKTKADSK